MKISTWIKSLSAAVLFSATGFVASAQNAATRNIWNDVSESSLTIKGERYTLPSVFRSVQMNVAEMKKLLATAPMEPAATSKLNGLIFYLPMPDGAFQRFSLFEYYVMHPVLAAKFPGIKTYTGQGIDDPYAIIKISMSNDLGLHAMVLSPNGSVFIDPYSKNNTTDYMSYYRKDLQRTSSFVCSQSDAIENAERNIQQANQLRTNGTQLRTYDLALACTGEYAAFFGGTVSGATAGMAATMNRVNGIYEAELSIRMQLVANNNLLTYTNSSTDPYTNGNGSTMLGQNQTNCDAVIGSANYDIGHVVSTGGGGVAGLGVVCSNGNKARGVTGSSSPTGDPFDVDYVAHEMGHQFGGSHTFNSTTGSCSGNRTSSAAYEPGSGITIQAYAGICGTDDLAPNSIAYFHGYSLDQMIVFSTTGTGNSCPATTATGNIAPVVTNMAARCSIPVSTPFILTGAATDGNGDPLTYSWEERDLGPAGAWNVQSTTAPQFRTFPPSTSPSRTFPKLSDIINNTTTVGELLPNQARNLNFRLTARDYRAGGGGIMHPDTNVVIVVVNSGGAFAVTAPNTAVTWAGGSAQTVTWNVSGTTGSGINTANVKISLSTDGGNTFPTVLLASTANDGSEIITVPNVATTTARIKVEAVGNIFFDMSNANFTITSSILSVITTSSIATTNYCPGSSLNVSFTTNGSANAGNIYTAQLSNSSGSFSSPVSIGSLSSASTSGTISCSIPTGTAAGSGYRIRVVSSNPAVNGSDNGANITIYTYVAAAGSINGLTSFCAWLSLQFSISPIPGAATYTWSAPAGTVITNGQGTTQVTIAFDNSVTSGNITVYGSNANCTGASSTLPITVLATPNIPFTSDVQGCSGTPIVLPGSPSGGSWSVANPYSGPSTTFYYTVTNSSTGCSASSWMAGGLSNNITVYSLPTPSINGNTSICQGSSTTLNAGSGYSSYIWSTGATTQTISVSTGGTYTVTVTNAAGCQGSDQVNVTVNPNPTPSISGNTPFCQGNSAILDAGSGYSSYSWSTGASTQTINVSTANTFTVTVTNVTGCIGSTSTSTTVNPLPSASTTPSGTVTTCNSSQTLTANSGAGLSYQWRFNGSNIGGATGISYNATASGNYDVVVTQSGCSSASTSVSVTLGTGSPVITSSAGTSICAGSNTVFTAPAGASAYQWYRNGTAQAGATGQTFLASSNGSYYCNVTGTCSGNSNTIILTVINNPTPAINNSSPLIFCNGGSVVLMSNAFSGITFQWQKNSVDIAGATGQSYTASTTGSYRVKQTANGCFKYAPAVSVNAGGTSVAAAITANGATTFCPGESVLITVDNAIPGYSYQWKNSGVIIGGATASSFSATSSGSYTCTIAASCGTATSNAITVSTGSISAVISPSGTITICSGASALLSANSGTGYTYQWKLNGSDISGATASTYNATTGGNYTVFINSSCGSATSPATTVNVNSVTASITPSGTTTICAGFNTTFSANTGFNYSYQWYRNGGAIGGATSSSYIASSNGSYTVVVSQGGACSATSAASVLSVTNNPTPSISPAGPVTMCAGQTTTLTANTFAGVIYQWQKNGMDISGATAQTYGATTAGSYRVKETANGCYKYAPAVSISINCRLAEINSTSGSISHGNINIHPNPFISSAEISLTGITDLKNIQIVLIDILGKEVKRLENIAHAEVTLEKGSLFPGIYFLQVIEGGNIIASKRIIIQ